MLRQRTTEYFGAKELPAADERPVIRNNLEFDNRGVDRIAAKIFRGMDVKGKGDCLSKEDLKEWTKAIL